MHRHLNRALLCALFLGFATDGFADDVARLVHQCDDAIAIALDHESALAAAVAIHEIGVAQHDPATEARGLIRIAFADLHFGKWKTEWEPKISRSYQLTEDLPSPHIARAEVVMFDSYLRAMYQHKFQDGIADLQHALTIARALHDDELICKAFYMLGRVLPFTGNDQLSFDYYNRSAMFAERAQLPAWEYAALQRLSMPRTLSNNMEQDYARRLQKLSVILNLKSQVPQPLPQQITDAREIVARVEPLLDQHLSETGNAPHEGLKAAEFLVHHYLAQQNWEEFNFYCDIAEHCAVHLQNEPVKNAILVDRASGLARQGKPKAAIAFAQPSIDYNLKTNRLAELSRIYAKLASQVCLAGDNMTALSWLQTADEYKTKHNAVLLESAVTSANNFFASEVESRKLQRQIHQAEVTLKSSQSRSTQWLIGLTLCAIGIWIAERMRHHRRAEKQLQEQVAQQTESLRIAKENAERANRAKTDYLARINHELRNPLTAIVASCNFLGNRLSTDPVAQKSGQTIQACTRVLLDVIDDVLDFTKIESGKLELREHEFSPQQLFETVEAVIQTKLPDGVALQLSIRPNVPLTVFADEPKLRQVLINLGMNSARHTDEGFVRIECGMSAEPHHGSGADGRPRLTISVIDTGCGMNESDLASVFDQYKTDELRPGTGLGLYICKAFVERMGGTIECSSRIGVGTNFTLEVPVNSVQRLPQAGRTSVTKNAVTRPHFLVIDDEAMNRDAISMLIESLEFDVDVAGNWEQASSVLQNTNIDIVLLDLRMPDLNGYEIIAKIRSLTINRPPAILAMTGDATSATRQQTAAAGFTGFLAKPFTVDDLMNALAAYGVTATPDHAVATVQT